MHVNYSSLVKASNKRGREGKKFPSSDLLPTVPVHSITLLNRPKKPKGKAFKPVAESEKEEEEEPVVEEGEEEAKEPGGNEHEEKVEIPLEDVEVARTDPVEPVPSESEDEQMNEEEQAEEEEEEVKGFPLAPVEEMEGDSEEGESSLEELDSDQSDSSADSDGAIETGAKGWSSEDQELFLQGVQRNGRHFQNISKHMGSKSVEDVRNYYKLNRQLLNLDELGSAAEQDRLSREKPMRDQKKSETGAVTRSGDATRPRAKRSAKTPSSHWTVEEKSQFLNALNTYGRSWRELSAAVPTRSQNQIKNFFQNYKGKLGLAQVAEDVARRQASMMSKKLKNIFYKDEKFDGKRVNEGEKDAFSYKEQEGGEDMMNQQYFEHMQQFQQQIELQMLQQGLDPSMNSPLSPPLNPTAGNKEELEHMKRLALYGQQSFADDDPNEPRETEGAKQEESTDH